MREVARSIMAGRYSGLAPLSIAVLVTLLAACGGQPIKKQPTGKANLTDVLNQARKEFQELKRYSISVSSSPGRCPLSLQVDDYVLSVSVKTTDTREVKTTGSAGPTTGVIQWTIGPEFDDSSDATSSTAITWQGKPTKVGTPPHGIWSTAPDKTNAGTWSTAPQTIEGDVGGLVQFDDAEGRSLVQPGESVTVNSLPTLNDLVRNALHEMIATSRPQPCVYPTGLEFHASFEVVSATSLDNKVALIFISATNQVTSKSDVVQDLDLKVNLKPGGVGLEAW